MTMAEVEEPTLVTRILNHARRPAAAGGRGSHLRAVRTPSQPDSDTGGRPLRWPWLATAFDVILITGTPSLAEALTRFSLFHDLATLGGHPHLVQLLALMALVVLVGLGATTQGFRRLARSHRSLLAVAGMLTVVAGAGWLLLLFFSPLLLIVLLVAKFL
jgi:hypothetical protein